MGEQVMVSSYTAQHPALATTLYSHADLFFSGKHSAMLLLMHKNILWKYPQLSVAYVLMYSVNWSNVE